MRRATQQGAPKRVSSLPGFEMDDLGIEVLRCFSNSLTKVSRCLTLKWMSKVDSAMRMSRLNAVTTRAVYLNDLVLAFHLELGVLTRGEDEEQRLLILGLVDEQCAGYVDMAAPGAECTAKTLKSHFWDLAMPH